MKSKLSLPSVLVGLCCIGILTAAYMPDELPLAFVEHHTEFEKADRGNYATALCSPDGRNLYLSMEERLIAYVRNPDTGELKEIQRVSNRDDLSNGSVLAIASQGERLFVPTIGARLADAVRQYERDGNSGTLTEILLERPFIADILNSLDGIACSHDAQHLYLVGGTENALAVLQRDDEKLQTLQILQDDDSNRLLSTGIVLAPWIKGAETVEDLCRPEAILMSRDDRFVYVGAADDASLTVFARDSETGRLKLTQRLSDHYNRPAEHLARVANGTPDMGLHGVQELAFSPDGAHLYGVANGISAFHRNSETGEVTFLQAIRTGEDNLPSLSGSQSVVVSKSGRHVFVAAPGSKNSHLGAITIFKRDLATGELEFLKVVDRKEVAGVRHLSLSPDGRHLYASTWYQTLAVFAVNEDAQSVPVEADGKSSVD